MAEPMTLRTPWLVSELLGQDSWQLMISFPVSARADMLHPIQDTASIVAKDVVVTMTSDASRNLAQRLWRLQTKILQRGEAPVEWKVGADLNRRGRSGHSREHPDAVEQWDGNFS